MCLNQVAFAVQSTNQAQANLSSNAATKNPAEKAGINQFIPTTLHLPNQPKLILGCFIGLGCNSVVSSDRKRGGKRTFLPCSFGTLQKFSFPTKKTMMANKNSSFGFVVFKKRCRTSCFQTIGGDLLNVCKMNLGKKLIRDKCEVRGRYVPVEIRELHSYRLKQQWLCQGLPKVTVIVHFCRLSFLL